MRNRVFAMGTVVLLVACMQHEDFGDLGCQGSVKTCRVVESDFGGYQRACVTTCPGLEAAPDDDDRDDADGSNDDSGGDADDSASDVAAVSESQSVAPEASAGRNVGAAPAPDTRRYSAFEMACERDSQCGPGKCLSGNCYYGCQSDSQCGSGDRCSVESGVRVCMPDPNPPVECTRSAQCDSDEGCLNGGCRQTCTSTEQCDNLLDRCASGFCLPDRRPLGECVVNSECDDGLVCLDGSCVPACPAEEEEAGGVCLADPSGPPPAPEDQTPSELPTSTPPESPADEGSEPTDEQSTDDAPPDDETPSSSEPEESADDADEPISDDGDTPASSDDGTTPGPEDDEPEAPDGAEEEPAP
jgi:hypothetical protein